MNDFTSAEVIQGLFRFRAAIFELFDQSLVRFEQVSTTPDEPIRGKHFVEGFFFNF